MDMDFIRELISNMKETRIANAGNLTVGSMLEKLNFFQDEEKVTFSNSLFSNGDYGSYRGYYEDLYIGWDNEDKGFNTVGELNKALSYGVMYGYKGGEYPITSDTLVWFAAYGDTGEMVVDIQKINGEIFIIVKED